MREIEFRVFVRDKKKIFNVKTIDFAYKLLTFEEENKPTDTIRMLDQVELMQYIGLKDKNGKKIFEGDIVKNDKGMIFVVEYFKYWSAFSLKIMYLFDEEENKLVRRNGRRYIYENEIYNIEIIGDIYDNPELLENN